MARKMRRFADGGSSIDDDVRERARKWMEEGSPEQDTGGKDTPNRKPAAKAKEESKEESKPKAETKEEYKARMEEISKKEPLEDVSPEDYVPGGGMLKAGLKAIVGAGARRAAKEGVKEGVKQLENKATKQIAYDKAGDLAKKRAARAEARDTEMKRSNAKNYGIDPDAPGSMSTLNSLRKNIGDGKFSMKKGGKVAGKLATRGYGKAR